MILKRAGGQGEVCLRRFMRIVKKVGDILSNAVVKHERSDKAWKH